MRSKPITLILFMMAFVLVMISCSLSAESESAKENKLEETPEFTNSTSVFELTSEQEDAFDALNELQISTSGHLYSTFVNSQYTHLTPDTSFTLSKTEFKETLTSITARFGNKLSQDEYKILVEKSILASNSYDVEFYKSDFILGKQNSSLIGLGLPTNGKWIVRSILNRRDLILDWQEPSGL